MTTRVLICDDQFLVHGGFRMIIEARPGLEVAGEAPVTSAVLPVRSLMSISLSAPVGGLMDWSG